MSCGNVESADASYITCRMYKGTHSYHTVRENSLVGMSEKRQALLLVKKGKMTMLIYNVMVRVVSIITAGLGWSTGIALYPILCIRRLHGVNGAAGTNLIRTPGSEQCANI